jgi:hypothetical protein
MRHGKIFNLAMGCVVVMATTLAAHEAQSAGPTAPRQVTPNSAGHGLASVYGDMPADQAEFLSTPDAIKSAAVSGAPTLVWEVLEHGEKVECLDCISSVAPLLYDSNAKTREIAAWWLRRRILGVFGPGQVYEKTIQTLADTTLDPVRRSYAAYALGEFFETPGIKACAQVLVNPSEDARVRVAAASALGRLNDDGGGALSVAFRAPEKAVKLAALGSAVRINTFSGLSLVAGLTTDGDADVRRRSIEVLDALRAVDTVMVVMMTAQGDADAGVRAAACHALGTFGDRSALALLQNLAQSDGDTFVRDQAQIALRRL